MFKRFVKPGCPTCLSNRLPSMFASRIPHLQGQTSLLNTCLANWVGQQFDSVNETLG